jgi:hypothetical protein
MVTSPTKHLPVGFELSDWKWGVFQPCEDYYTISACLELDPTAKYSLRYKQDYLVKRMAGKDAGHVSSNYAGSRSGNGRRRAKDYHAVRVTVPKCNDAWAPIKSKTQTGSIQIAKVIWLLLTGNWPPPHFIVDHIDVNACNNSISNIRIVTRGMNVQNRNTTRKTSSKKRNAVLKKLDQIAEPLVAVGQTFKSEESLLTN